MMTSSKPKFGTLRRMALSEAQSYIKNYLNQMGTLKVAEGDILRAFRISRDELMNTLGVTGNFEGGYEHIRVYLGMDNNKRMHLFLVPVEFSDTSIAGTDVIYYGEVEGTQTYYVYDFNTPCPTTCDIASPMYTLQPMPDGNQ